MSGQMLGMKNKIAVANTQNRVAEAMGAAGNAMQMANAQLDNKKFNDTMKNMMKQGKNVGRNVGRKLKQEWKNFWKEEDGMGTVEIVLILVILVGLVILFREFVIPMVTSAIEKIKGDTDTIIG